MLTTASAIDLSFSWQASPTPGIATYRLKWLSSFLVTTKTFAVISNFPMETVFAVTVVATTTNGAESDPSLPVVDIFVNGKLTSLDFAGRPALLTGYQAWLEFADAPDLPFTTLALLDTFGILPNQRQRFYRVRLQP